MRNRAWFSQHHPQPSHLRSTGTIILKFTHHRHQHHHHRQRQRLLIVQPGPNFRLPRQGLRGATCEYLFSQECITQWPITQQRWSFCWIINHPWYLPYIVTPFLMKLHHKRPTLDNHHPFLGIVASRKASFTTTGNVLLNSWAEQLWHL